MSDGKGVREKFTALRKRAGLTMSELAKALGYSGPSSLQRYEIAGDYALPYLPGKLVAGLADVLEGKGQPPISRNEVLALGVAESPAAASSAPHNPEHIDPGVLLLVLQAFAERGLVNAEPNLFASAVIDVCLYLQDERASEVDPKIIDFQSRRLSNHAATGTRPPKS